LDNIPSLTAYKTIYTVIFTTNIINALLSVASILLYINIQLTEAEVEQAVEAAKRLDGVADILWIRDGRMEHPILWHLGCDAMT
jgi:hypothetical protein